MSRLVARAETWERVYDAFQNVNFAAFDYNTVKRSVLDYIKLYFPETFNDFIESSELVAIIEVFAYIAELMAYRLDVNAHENFISTAQRKDSILRLAKLVSYTASRPLPARGLVKITSVSTTESMIDASGNDLANRTVRWNDVNNTNWKDQFSLVMNRVLDQQFGSVNPNDRFQIQDVLFETYSWNLTPLANGVFTYTASVNGRSIPMELVPATYSATHGIVERRPQTNKNFTILFGQDGLGDASDTTGFFCFSKQGSLQRFRTTFDGITPNQTYDINIDNVNDTDVWVNNIDPASGEILDVESLLPYSRESRTGKSGEWVEVDLAHAQNVIFNTNPKRNKYEVETRANSRARLIFGDGEFADVPLGTFDIWARTSVDEDILIPQSAVSNTSASFTYVDAFNRTQTFSFTFSLVGSLQNASAAEDIEHVRQTAPAVYYSQDRMVNGEDYNVFPLQDPSILKLRAVNRTFAGASKYISWHDASGTYENVKMVGDDGILYFEDRDASITSAPVDSGTLISSYVQPLLSSSDLFLQLAVAGVTPQDYKRTFTSVEITRISEALNAPAPVAIDLYYNKSNKSWYAISESATLTDLYPAGLGGVGYNVTPTLSEFINKPLIKIDQISALETRFSVTRVAKRIVFQSPTTKFWHVNSADRVVNYDTLRTSLDTITILAANLNHNRTDRLRQNWTFNVLGQEVNEFGSEIGLPDENRLSIMTPDDNQDGVPDHIDTLVFEDPKGVADIMLPKIRVTSTQTLTLPVPYIKGEGDIIIINRTGANAVVNEAAGDDGSVQTTVIVQSLGTNSEIAVCVRDYVYFTREATDQQWVPVPTSLTSIRSFVLDRASTGGLWKREEGRSDLMFTWMHNSPRYYLVDPAASNLVDMFVITKGYFTELKRWLEDPLAEKPELPTPLDLRTSYTYLLENKMISDTAVLHPGKFKLIFGSRAEPALQATIKIVRSNDRTLTDNQIKTAVVTAVRNFFNITQWEFGETFYFTELSAAIHAALPTEISSVVLVPVLRDNYFGTLYQVMAREDEVFYPDITASDIDIVTSLNANTLNISGRRNSASTGPSTAPGPVVYQLDTDIPTVNEGGTITVTLSTMNVADGTVVPYTISGGNITAADFASQSLTGTFTVVNNTASVQLVMSNDLATEGVETVSVALNNGSAFVEFAVADSSTAPVIPVTYTFTASAYTINEGQSTTITLSTTGLNPGTVVEASITGIQTSDLDNLSNEEKASGLIYFTLDGSGQASRTLYARADLRTEGDEGMTISLTNGLASIGIGIVDTSTAAPPPPPPPPPNLVWTVTPNPVTASATEGQWSSYVTITVANSGSSNQGLVLTGVDYTLSGAGSDTQIAVTFPYTLAPGASFSFNVRFMPTAAGTPAGNSVNIYSTNGGTKVTPLSVTGISAAPTIQVWSVDKGSYVVGEAVVATYRVINDSAWDKFGYSTPSVFTSTSNGVTKTLSTNAPGTAGTYPLVLRASNGSATVDATAYVVVTGYPQINLTGAQSLSGCYSAQSGFSVDQYADGSVLLNIGTWPSDPPACQTANWTWLKNHAAENTTRVNSNTRPFWAKTAEVSITNIPIGGTIYTRIESWPYTLVSYTFAITRTSANRIEIRSYIGPWYTGDTGTSISIGQWFDKFQESFGGTYVPAVPGSGAEGDAGTPGYWSGGGVCVLTW